MKILPTQFEGHDIRRVHDEATDTWWFSVVDVVQVLTDSNNARRYWSDLKRKLAQEAGSEQAYEKIVQLKLPTPDGKQRLTDCASAVTLLRVVQSIPSPKAEPIKLWLAEVGYERMQEMADPALSLDRARQTWQQHGQSDKWIQQRMTGQETRSKLAVRHAYATNGQAIYGIDMATGAEGDVANYPSPAERLARPLRRRALRGRGQPLAGAPFQHIAITRDGTNPRFQNPGGRQVNEP